MMYTLLALALAAPPIVRCVCVAIHISPRAFKKAHCPLRWHGFAWSYVALGAAAAFAALDVHLTGGTRAEWLFLAASAGLVVFDPRRRAGP